jgi:patatin-like phospholipase/acyl hydrolase
VAASYCVLAIDGGGIRGIIPATVLADLERLVAPRAVADVFDLIVGTSTGGILALGLTVPDAGRPRHPAERLLELYVPRPRPSFRVEGRRPSRSGSSEPATSAPGSTTRSSSS